MLQAVTLILRDEMSFFKFLGLLLLAYYGVMDVVLYVCFMSTDIVESSKPLTDQNELFSPFTHLSVKALMNDHTSQFIFAPLTEYFDAFTHFSTIFHFISPNMVSFFHLLLALIAARLISSEVLRTRRTGVLLFEFRTILDALDGVVFRSHSNTRGTYQSVRASSGYYVDLTCDCVGGVFLMFGIFFYLLKTHDSSRQSDQSWKTVESGVTGKLSVSDNTNGIHSAHSKQVIFWKCFCYGVSIALGAKFWDNTVSDFRRLFQETMTDPSTKVLQFDIAHSGPTALIMWAWRLFEGQALLQFVLVATFIDRVLEFLSLVQYWIFVVIIGLYSLTCLYVKHVEVLLLK